MKNPLKLVLLLAGAVVLAAPVVRAEDPAPPADHPDRPERGPGRRGPGAMWDRIAKELNLTADQEAQWKEIGQQERAVAEPIFKDSSLSREEKRAKLMEVNKPFAEQRRAVLTPEQQTKFDEMRAKMRERGERGERGPRKPKDS
jgi:Spy/CpxP family protein refolding chaperone